MSPDCPPRPRLRERFREVARVEILEAAERRFVRDGLIEARIDAIAEDSGVSVGTVYNLFKDRAGLVEALMEWRRAELHERLFAVLGPEGPAGFEGKLGAVVHSLFDHFRDRWAFMRLLSQALAAPDTPISGKAPYKSRELIAQAHAGFVGLVTLGVEEGRLDAPDVDLAAVTLMGFLSSNIMVTLGLGRDAPDEQRADAVIALFLRCFGRR
jgi:AcrR family transcriptional regulator